MIKPQYTVTVTVLIYIVMDFFATDIELKNQKNIFVD